VLVALALRALSAASIAYLDGPVARPPEALDFGGGPKSGYWPANQGPKVVDTHQFSVFSWTGPIVAWQRTKGLTPGERRQ
jgi:hypothetical protein